MTAYVDGEVTDDEAVDVRAHLTACSSCRERAEAEQTARKVLRTRAPMLGERASASLRARCVSMAPSDIDVAVPVDRVGGAGRWRGWAPLSMAAAVLLAVGAVFFIGQHQRLEAAFAAQLALDHERCFTYLDEVNPAFGQREAEVSLAALSGITATLPAESAEFDLVDVRECLYDAGAMAHVLCRWRGEPVSLFVVPGESRREQVLEIVGHDAVVWSESDSGYVLVAEHGPVDLGQVADYVRGSSD
jgi:anti-sigma factor RsiW